MVTADERKQEGALPGIEMQRDDFRFVVPVPSSSGHRARQRAKPQLIRFIALSRDLRDDAYLVSLAEPADQLMSMEFAAADGRPVDWKDKSDAHRVSSVSSLWRVAERQQPRRRSQTAA